LEQVKNILILSTSNPYKTAGVVSYDLFKGFKKNNYTVKLVVENYDKYEDGIISVQNKHEVIFKKIKNRVRKAIFKLFNFKDKNDTIPDYHFDSVHLREQSYSTKRIIKKASFKPDVIILIFSQYFISLKNLKELQVLTNAPIIWQFADMFPFTGGCHYAWDCDGYKKLCKTCPAILNNQYKSKPNKVLLNNKEYIKDLNITAVIGSDWLTKRAKNSTMFKDKPIKKIYLSLDSDLFIPFNNLKKVKLREKYEIDQDKTVILIMANHLSQKRKGIDLILNGLSTINKEYIKNKNCHLVIVGGGFEKIKDKIPSYVPYTQIDSIDRNNLPEIYNLSDLFVSASLQDVGPYTITEALLCSVPVVSLNHGYANEFVLNGETGILIENDFPDSLAKGIIKMIDMKENEMLKIKNNCRNRTVNIVSKSKQIKEYINLIDSFKL